MGLRIAGMALVAVMVPVAALADGEDALVPGTPYHATGMIPCLPAPDAEMTECAFGVTRAGEGNAQVDVTAPDGDVWSIMFEAGAPVSVAGPEGWVAPLPDLNFAIEDTAMVVSIGTISFDIFPEIINGG